jgi:succinoglycan biosynthesis protein ExoL
MHITYFAADLTDPATERRLRLLRTGGADISLFGFRRSPQPIPKLAGIAAVDLGQTFDGQLGNRLKQVLRWSVMARHWHETVAASDVVMARNLEMATIADAARLWARSKARLVYECLDIHATQIGTGNRSKVLRSWERRILQRASLLIISSPTYLPNYFNNLGIALPSVVLAENKRMLSPGATMSRPAFSERSRPPWRIGWFGLLRCVTSFKLLLELAQQLPGRVDITLRGRPTADLNSLITQHLPIPGMRFGGPYTAVDLDEMYPACDFTWAVEYVGQNAENAKWALGNRLYEGGFYNCPAIALTGTAMGAWLQARNAGVVMNDPAIELGPFISRLTAAQYHDLHRSTANIPTDDLVWTTDDCRQLVRQIVGHPTESLVSQRIAA